MATEVRPRFDIGLTLKAATNGDAMLLAGVASSDSRDLGNDIFAVSALRAMKAAFDTGEVPVMLDHIYASGEQVAGKVVESRLAAPNAKGITNLEVTIQTSASNPRAVMIFNQIKGNEAPYGLSVGVLVDEARNEKVDGETALVIRSCRLLELSITPLPANPSARGLTAKHAAWLAAQNAGEDTGELQDARTLVRFLLSATKGLRAEVDERDLIIAELLPALNWLMDQPVGRKCDPALVKNLDDLADKFPTLVPEVRAMIARSQS